MASIVCPRCGARLRYPDDSTAAGCRCPKCGTTVRLGPSGSQVVDGVCPSRNMPLLVALGALGLAAVVVICVLAFRSPGSRDGNRPAVDAEAGTPPPAGTVAPTSPPEATTTRPEGQPIAPAVALAASDADAVASRRMLRLVVQRMAEAANAGEQKQAAGKKAVDEINAMFAEMTFEVTYPIRGVKRQAEGFRLLLGAPVGMDTVGGLSNNASYMLLKLPEADSPAPKPGDRLTIHGKARCLSTSFSDKEELAATGRYIRPILLETACGAVVVGIADSTFAVEAKTPPPAEP